MLLLFFLAILFLHLYSLGVMPSICTVSESNAETVAVDCEVRTGSSEPPVPLTRNDIPDIVQEIARQLCPESSEAHISLAPSMFNFD